VLNFHFKPKEHHKNNLKQQKTSGVGEIKEKIRQQ
jgi:hypothetical protein